MDAVEKLEEMLGDLERFCYNNKYPMIVCVATDNTGEESDFKTRMLSGFAVGKKLKKDRIADMALMFNGFEAVPPNTPFDLELFCGGVLDDGETK